MSADRWAVRHQYCAPIARQSRLVLGWKKLIASSANSAVFKIPRGHRSYVAWRGGAAKTRQTWRTSPIRWDAADVSTVVPHNTPYLKRTCSRLGAERHLRHALRTVPEAITDPERVTRLDIRRNDRIGGVIHEHRHAA